MTVRLTELRDGCVLAVCCSHACVDGTGFLTVMREWSRAVAGAPIATPPVARPAPPAPPRAKGAVARSARDAGMHPISLCTGLRYLATTRLARERAFVGRLSADALRGCHRACQRESPGERVTLNTALVAHVTRCLTTLLRFAPDAPITVSVVADTRGRLAAFPRDYVGNASTIVCTEAMPAGAPRGEIAARIQRELRRTLSRSTARLAAREALLDEVIVRRVRFLQVPLGRMMRRRPSHIYTNSFATYPIYDLDFGGVRPIRVVPPNLGDPVMIWPAPPDVGGVEVHVGGPFARHLRTLADDDPWWSAFRQFEAPDHVH